MRHRRVVIFFLFLAFGFGMVNGTQFETVYGAPSGTDKSIQYLYNSSVETASPSDPNQPDGWFNNSWGNNNATFTYLNEGHTGNRSVKVEIENCQDGDAKWFFNPIELAPGDYMFSDYYRSNADSKVILAVTTDIGMIAYIDLPVAPASTSWKEYASSFTMPENGRFVTVLHVLAGNGYLITDDYGINPYQYEGFNNGMVTITFDDGWEENTETALLIMQNNGFKSNQFYATTFIENPRVPNPESLIRKFIDAGHEIGSHSVTHPDLTTLTDEQVTDELVNSKSFLESYLGVSIKYFATPYGAYNATVKDSIMQYYLAHRTAVDFGYNSRDNLDLSRLKSLSVLSATTPERVEEWVTKAKSEKLWLILLYHRIGDDPEEYDTTQELFDAQMNVIKDANIEVVTISEALAEIGSENPVPSTPTLTAKSAGYDGVKLSWTSATEATGHELYRATSSGGDYTKIKTLTGTSYTNTGLTTGKTYYYKVRAYRTVGSTTTYGEYSSVKSAKPVPATPTLTASSAGYNSVKLSWTSVSGRTGYKLYRATSSGGAYSLVKTTTSTSYTNTGLTTGKTYYYKVRAYRTVGSTTTYGAYSSVKSAKPVPATPTLTAKSAGYNSVKLSWTSVSGRTGYRLYRATSSGGAYSLVKTTTSTSYTNTGLTTGKTYYYKVRAYRTVGSTTTYGGYSSVKSAKPVPATPTLTAKSAGYNGVKLSWTSVSGRTGYRLYRATSSGGAYSLVKTTTSTSYTNAGLTTGKTYYYKVRAYRTVGSTTTYGAYSSVKSAKPVPSKPASVKAARASSKSIKVTWGAVSGATKYQVYRATSKTGTYSLKATTSSRSYTNTGLTTGKYYYYKVRAYHLEGSTKVYGSFSSVVYAKP